MNRSLFGRMVENRSASMDALLSVFGQRYGAPSYAGPVVTPDSAMQHATVWAAVTLLSDLVATFTWDAWRESDSQLSTVRAPQIVREPSLYVDERDWRRQIMVSWLLRGNAYGIVQERDTRGIATRIDVIHPDRVTVMRMSPLLGPWKFMVMGKQMDLYPFGDLFHVPAFTVPGSPVGLSPINYARQSIGVGLGAEEFAARFFGDGAHPTAIITTDNEVNKEQAEVVKDRVMQAIKGRREPAVLGAGMKWNQIQIAPEESQFLETIKANRLTIAQFFGLASAAELIGADSAQSMTYANVSQKSLNLLTYGLRPWLVKMQGIYDALTPSTIRVRPNVDELLQVDPKTRADIQAEQVRAGLRTQNEVRLDDHRPPLEGGDRLAWPPYATSAGAPESTSTDGAPHAP